MTAVSISARDDLRRWVVSGAVVLGLHAAGAALLVTWHDPLTIGEPSSAIVVDLEPFATPPSDRIEDLAPGPKQQEVDAPPPEPTHNEQKVDEKIDVPPTPVPAVAALPPPEPIDQPQTTPVVPVPTTTAPPVAHASQAQINEWFSAIAQAIKRHKAYPRAARERGETGIVALSFTLDRDGHLVSSHVDHGSGHPELDRAAVETIEHAQPFQPPPAGMLGAAFNFRMPVEFSIR